MSRLGWKIRHPGRTYRSVPQEVLVHMAWRNIVSKKLRSGLTMLGIVIGIGAIFFLLSFGIGLRNIVTKEVLGNQSVRAIDINTPNSKILKLDATNARKIGDLPHVKEISSTFAFPGSLRYSGSEVEGIVYGIDMPYQDLTSLNLTQGRLLNRDDVHAVVINRPALKAMGISNERDVVGKTLSVTVPLSDYGASKAVYQQDLVIVGVIDSGAGTEVFIPKFNFEALSVPVYSDMKVLADQTKSVNDLRNQIESLGFQSSSPLDTSKRLGHMVKLDNWLFACRLSGGHG